MLDSIPYMEWEVLADEEFVIWAEKQPIGLQDEILAYRAIRPDAWQAACG